MVGQANRHRRRGRGTALGVATALAVTLVATLFSVVVSAGSASAADWTVNLRLTKTDARKIVVRADVNRNVAGSGYVLAVWDTTTGAQVAACNNGVTSCNGTQLAGFTWTQSTVIPTASTTDLSSVAHTYVATLAPAGDGFPDKAVASSAPQTADPWTVSLNSSVLGSKQVQLTAFTNYSIPGTGYTLSIFDKTTGVLLKSCNSGETPCDGSVAAGNYYTRTTVVPKATSTELSSVPHEYVAILAGITDALPGDNVAATSPVTTLDPWKLTVSAVQTTARTLQLTAVTNYNIVPSGYTLSIFDQTTGALLKSCSSGETICNGSTSIGYYWSRTTGTPRGSTSEESAAPHQYVAVLAQDASSLPGVNVAATSDAVTAVPWSVTLTTVASGASSFRLDASSTSYTLAGSGYTLGIYDETTGERVAVCGTGYGACAGTSSAANVNLRTIRSVGFGDSFVAVISDDSATLPASNVAAQSGSVVPQ